MCFAAGHGDGRWPLACPQAKGQAPSRRRGSVPGINAKGEDLKGPFFRALPSRGPEYYSAQLLGLRPAGRTSCETVNTEERRRHHVLEDRVSHSFRN